jgi:hypothetical protein
MCVRVSPCEAACIHARVCACFCECVQLPLIQSGVSPTTRFQILPQLRFYFRRSSPCCELGQQVGQYCLLSLERFPPVVCFARPSTLALVISRAPQIPSQQPTHKPAELRHTEHPDKPVRISGCLGLSQECASFSRTHTHTEIERKRRESVRERERSTHTPHLQRRIASHGAGGFTATS